MSNPLAGIVVLTRHGDRQGFYQSPKTYTASNTNLTVLGYRQQLFNGQDLRARYLLPTSPTAIGGIDSDVAENAQLSVLADAGGEGGVIVESSLALLQGFYPPYDESITLANGTSVDWSGRVQLIPVETVEPEQSIAMEPWTDCRAWTQRLNKWYGSSEFKQKAAEANAFYDSIQGLLGSRPRLLENAWNIYDFLNVERIHDSTLAPQITDDILRQAGTWANYHETVSFSDADPKDIGNVAGQAMLSLLLDGIAATANATDPLKVNILAASYKPFLSLFKMLSIPQLEDNLIDYASTMVFEVYADQTVQVVYRNGSSGAFEPYPILGASSGSGVKVSDMEDRLRPYTISTLAQWCDACSTTDARGCEALYRLNGTGSDHGVPVTSTYGQHAVSPVVAGLIGAMVTLALGAALLGALAFFTGSSLTLAPSLARRKSRAEAAAAAGSEGGGAAARTSTNFASRFGGRESLRSAISLQADTLAGQETGKTSFELLQSPSRDAKQ
ncbi:uncharacterized protein PFL1_04967 [Pseudozyma flocculosa PF-1]|uniref:Acid phosphatase n=2 Tax=Pseudozyma flocculosa TaxID=84751 RepID=A0A5C3EVS1_9BASI|nr:uncharacterized protein PFL1_04967 [Pseudozyma flocculosa PF-1]EPQ27429.1 hypothetical protein PFL1_04967 [Pseudozyma flocculosa PF-1]SPO36142.1 uncharacterized protein PSFLO_01613 [Pseudozyma flocculosa]